jgi:hypothetical protein
VDALIALERQRAWLDGVQQQLLAEVVRHDSGKDQWSREEVSAALGLSLQTAQSRMKDAEQLCSRLPGTLAALMAGSISCLQARAVTEASYVLDAGLLAEFEARVLRRAGEQTLAQLKQTIRRADPARPRHRRGAPAARHGRPQHPGRRGRGRHGLADDAAANRSGQGLLHPRRRHR